MTNRNTWKTRERQVAEWLGTIRKPVSGRQIDKDGDDCEHPKIHVQQKHRKSHAILNVWRGAKAYCQKSGKIPVVTLTEHNRKGFWLVIHCDDFKKIAKIVMEEDHE